MAQEASPVKMLSVLTGVCLLSAAILSYVFISSEGRIEENRQARIRQAVFEVQPGIDNYERVETELEQPVFKVYKNGKNAGYAILASGMGFQGEISLMVGLSQDLKQITGVFVLESVETPGLGDKIRGEDFRSQFKGMEIPEGSIKVDTITGATISSKAVQKIVNRAIDNVKNIY